jgi:hypothetical protein
VAWLSVPMSSAGVVAHALRVAWLHVAWLVTAWLSVAWLGVTMSAAARAPAWLPMRTA